MASACIWVGKNLQHSGSGMSSSSSAGDLCNAAPIAASSGLGCLLAPQGLLAGPGLEAGVGAVREADAQDEERRNACCIPGAAGGEGREGELECPVCSTPTEDHVFCVWTSQGSNAKDLDGQGLWEQMIRG